MAFDKNKGLLSIATSYSGGNYSYKKIDGYIGAENITITPDQIQDLDSYRNANGKLKRNALKHRVTKIDINTAFMNEEKMERLLGIINTGTKLDDGECKESERKLRIRFYNSWKCDYATAFCYVPDVEFQYYSTAGGNLRHQPIRIAFIEY